MTTNSKTITFAYSDKDERAWSHPTEGWATEADWAFISTEFRAAIEAHPEFHGWTTTPKWKACVECGEEITQWWVCEEGDAYCAGCFAATGASCGGCANEACVQCNEDSESDDERDARIEALSEKGLYLCSGCQVPFKEEILLEEVNGDLSCEACYTK